MSLVRVDDTGVGGGVSDRLREMGLNVVRVNFGASGDADYLNQTGVLWGGLREKMGVIGLPDDDELVANPRRMLWTRPVRATRRAIPSLNAVFTSSSVREPPTFLLDFSRSCPRCRCGLGARR